jgi:threonine/homoserine/homoserine lactone efflux protein
MISWHAFLAYCGIYAVAIAIPGPGVIAILARALGSGFRSSIPAAFGTAAGDLTLMTFSAFGLAVIAQAMGSLFLVVKLAGAGYLIWLGVRYWTAPVAELGEIVPDKASRSFFSHYLVTVGNPKAIAFFVALLPMAIDVRQLGAIGYAQLCAATMLLLPTIMLTYAALASRVRGLLASRRARTRMNKGAGVIMVGAGIGVAVS